MTVVNPPGFLQNAGATHTAEQFRNHLGLFVAGKQSSTSLIPRGGVNPTLGSALQVTQAGSPSMNVVVKSGLATIPGSQGSKQGVYTVINDADVTLAISAAHASLNRIDIVVFKVEDTAYSGGVNSSSLAVVTGTPSGSPSAPAAPNNSIILAQVSIIANDTSITNGEITDRRTYMAATGGIINCTSSTRPAANTVCEGQLIYESDTDRILVTHNSGTSWVGLNDRIMLARGRRITGSTTTTTEVGVLRLDDIPMVAGRIYKIYTSTLQLVSSVANDGISANLRYTTDGSTPTTSSTLLTAAARDGQSNATTGFGTIASALYAPAGTETFSVLLSVARVNGTGNCSISGSASFPIDLIIQDFGTDPTDTGTDI